jgi:hypothetical protein
MALVGRIARPHGLRGEVVVNPETDFVEKRFGVGATVWTNAACAVDNTGHATFDPGDPPPDALLCFVIVGQNAVSEGSYGTGTFGERAEAIGIGACDKPQTLAGSCP